MTGKDLVLETKAKLNQLDTAANRAVRPEMVLLFLNDAYKKLVRAKYADNGGREDTTAFQFTQLTTDELNHVTGTHSLVPVKSLTEDNIYEITPTDAPNYWIHLKSKIRVKAGDKESWQTPSLKTLDVIGTIEGDPFNASIYVDPAIYFEDGKIKIPVTGFTVPNYLITYLKKVTPITLEGTVLAPFEDQIVDSAVTAILENWKDGRVTTQMSATKIANSV